LEQSFKTSLDAHLLNCRWATEGWLEHIQSLEEIVDNLTSHLLSIGDRNTNVRLEAGAIGSVQEYEDMTNETVLVLESNAEIMVSMARFYSSIVADQDFPSKEKRGCRRIVKTFTSQLEELIYDTKTQMARGRILAKMISDRKTVLIQHLQAQAAARAEEFTATMWKAAERSEKEAIAMRIITVITLIYLPPTFSSTFFSTDVVKYQNGGGQGSDGRSDENTSWLALWRWLEVSLPLMAITFAIAIGWYGWEWHKRQKRNRMLRLKHPDVFARVEAEH